MEYLKNFKIFEAKIVTVEDWAGAWQDLPEWKLLRLMGFEIYDTNFKGTLTIHSPYSGVKLRITSAGYVRTSSQGYVYQYQLKNPMPKMLGYVITRFIKKGITLISTEDLDSLMKNNPEMIKYLAELPKIRQDVLDRTGINDSLGDLYKKYNLTPSTVKWLDKSSKKSWKINETTEKIDVLGSFEAEGTNLGFRGVKFGEILYDFEVMGIGLTSLEGSPEKVGGSFRLYGNDKLTSLKGGPLDVGREFLCTGSNLYSLEGSPLRVGGRFLIGGSKLTSLFGAPLEIGGTFAYAPDLPKKMDTFEIKKWNFKGWLEGLSVHPNLFGPFILDRVQNIDVKYLTPEAMILLKKNYPEAFDAVSKRVGDSASTLADLGELGF